jgi:quercetin dioxygenase-like cupin family protein
MILEEKFTLSNGVEIPKLGLGTWFITDGTGYYQEKGKPAQLLKPGDVVTIPPNIVHWHGASPESRFVHIGMSTKVDIGPAEWFGPVTDKEYNDATSP